MKLVEALEALNHNLPHESPVLEIKLACGFMPLHFSTFLGGHLRRQFSGHRVAISTGAFGDLAGNLERLAGVQGSIVVAIVEWQNLDPRLGIRLLGGWNSGKLNDFVQTVRDKVSRVWWRWNRRPEQHRYTVPAYPTLATGVVYPGMVVESIGGRLTRRTGDSLIGTLQVSFDTNC